MQDGTTSQNQNFPVAYFLSQLASEIRLWSWVEANIVLSPTVASDKDDSDYKYAKYKVRTTSATVVATPPRFLSIRAMSAMR